MHNKHKCIIKTMSLRHTLISSFPSKMYHGQPKHPNESSKLNCVDIQCFSTYLSLVTVFIYIPIYYCHHFPKQFLHTCKINDFFVTLTIDEKIAMNHIKSIPFISSRAIIH